MVAMRPDGVATAVPDLPEPPMQHLDTAALAQVERWVQGLLAADLHSAAFTDPLECVGLLGRTEIASTTALLQGRFMQRSALGLADSAVFVALQDLRELLGTLDPGRAGALSAPRKLLGLIPWGHRLQDYFGQFQNAAVPLQHNLQQVYGAHDEMQRELIELELGRTRLAHGLQQLADAAQLTEGLEARLTTALATLETTDAERSRLLQHELLWLLRQNRADLLAQQAVCRNADLALALLQQTAQQMMDGCARVTGAGISALALAQTLARANGCQLEIMELLAAAGSTLERLGTPTALAGQPAADDIDKLKYLFAQTVQAIDDMERLRRELTEVLGQQHRALQAQLTHDSTDPAQSGPVTL